MELDALRQEVLESRGASDAAYIRKVIDVQRKIELGLARRAALLDLPAGLDRRHRRPVRRQDPRQHGGRPQHPPRPVGLDARPQDPLDDVGVGQRHPGRAVEAQPQRAAPHVHQRDRQGQRPRLRHHARRRGPALDAGLPRPADLQLRQHVLLPVRHRRLRPRDRQAARRPGRQGGVQAQRQDGAAQGRSPGPQGLPPPPAAVGPVVLPHHRGQRDGQLRPQRLDALDHHVRPLPERASRPSPARPSRARAVASGTCARCSVRPTSRAARPCTSCPAT